MATASPVEFWNRVADRCAARAIKDPAACEAMPADAAGPLRPGDRALDIGCGTGSIAIRLAPHAAEWAASDLSRAVAPPAAKTSVSTTTLRPSISATRSRSSSGPPIGAGFRKSTFGAPVTNRTEGSESKSRPSPAIPTYDASGRQKRRLAAPLP